LAGRLRQVADVHDLPEIRAKSRIFGGWATALQGFPAEGLNEFEQGLTTQRAIGTTEDMPVYHGLWAELLLLSNAPEQALSVLDDGIAEADATGNVVWLPELYRLRALTRPPDAEGRTASQADLERAITLADGQGAVSLVLRAREDQRNHPAST
jgi:predicted ATPase